MGSKVSDLLQLSAPCFSCQYCYICRFWRNNLWCDWILKNNECPVGKYTFESLEQAYILEEERRKEEKQREHAPPKAGYFRVGG